VGHVREIRAGGESRYYTGASKHDMEPADKPSKTRRKKDMHALQALGASLVELSAAQLAAIDMPEPLRDAVIEARRITSHEARRRQVQYIGRLMRDIDPTPIRAKLDEWQGQSRSATALLHAAERWRDRLLADEGALAAFSVEHSGRDLQRLRSLVRTARAEQAAGKPPRALRELFREIRGLLETRSSPDAE
jgi:ribosome-associated protein